MALLNFNHKLKLRSQTEDKPLNQIYNEELSNMSKANNISNKEFADNQKFQSFQSIKSCMQKRRGTRRQRMPKSLKDIFLTDEQKKQQKIRDFCCTKVKTTKY